MLENGTSRWNNLVAWALHHLSRARLVERPRKSRAEYRITPRGLDALSTGEAINVQFCMQYPEWHRSKRERALAEGRLRERTVSAPPGQERPTNTRAIEQGADPLDRLTKLADLRDRGALSAAEFDAMKAQILRNG